MRKGVPVGTPFWFGGTRGSRQGWLNDRQATISLGMMKSSTTPVPKVTSPQALMLKSATSVAPAAPVGRRLRAGAR